MIEPLTREERDNILWALSCSNGGLDADGVRAYIAPWVATVQAAEERADALRAAIRSAQGLYDQSMMESRPGMALHLRVSADKILHDALAADDAKRGDQSE